MECSWINENRNLDDASLTFNEQIALSSGDPIVLASNDRKESNEKANRTAVQMPILSYTRGISFERNSLVTFTAVHCH